MDKDFKKHVLTNLDDFKTITRASTPSVFYIKMKKGNLYKADVQFCSTFNSIRDYKFIILSLIKCMYIIFRSSYNSVLPNGNDAKTCLVKIQKFPM